MSPAACDPQAAGTPRLHSTADRWLPMMGVRTRPRFMRTIYNTVVFAVLLGASSCDARGNDHTPDAARPAAPDGGEAPYAASAPNPVPGCPSFDAEPNAPPVTSSSSDPSLLWARDPVSGVCCEYASSALAARTFWELFASELECNAGGCSCSAVAEAFPDQEARSPLSCFCGRFSCAANLGEALATPCADVETRLVATGCGKVELSVRVAFVGRTQVFDSVTEELIGVTQFADAHAGVCEVFQYVFGEPFRPCPEAENCVLCGSDAAFPFAACP